MAAANKHEPILLQLPSRQGPMTSVREVTVLLIDSDSDSREICFRLFDHLKADPVTAAIPVIAVTGYVLPDDQERAKRAGVAEFLPKPVDLVRLLRTVENLVG
ncbi:hypothetical protein BH23GEM5_BH23GEM5_17560 [soil metagenome]